MQLLYTFRMNDSHFARGLPIEWSTFNRQHPQYNLAGKRTPFDYAHPEVRNHRYAQYQEIVEKYDVDGIELDFTRDPTLFQSDYDTHTWIKTSMCESKTPIMNEFVERVRAVLDRAGVKRGKRLKLAVHTPQFLPVCLFLGLDVGEWIARGWIDTWVYGGLGPWMNLDMSEDIQAAHEHGVELVVTMNHRIDPRQLPDAWSRSGQCIGCQASGRQYLVPSSH